MSKLTALTVIALALSAATALERQRRLFGGPSPPASFSADAVMKQLQQLTVIADNVYTQASKLTRTATSFRTKMAQDTPLSLWKKSAEGLMDLSDGGSAVGSALREGTKPLVEALTAYKKGKSTWSTLTETFSKQLTADRKAIENLNNVIPSALKALATQSSVNNADLDRFVKAIPQQVTTMSDYIMPAKPLVDKLFKDLGLEK